jgi:hypothetical protein
MKTSLRLPLTALLFAFVLVVLSGNSLRAGPVAQTFLVTVDENGHSHFDVVGLFSGSLNSFVGQDSGPGGLSNALIYQFSGSLSVQVTAGDLFLTDSPNGISDVVRFNPGTGQNDPSTLVFYSLLGGSEMADTGFPTQNYANQKSILEDEINGTFYTPLPGEPGYISGLATTYQLFSGPNAITNGVPETGSTMLLLAVAVIGMIVCQRAVRLPH